MSGAEQARGALLKQESQAKEDLERLAEQWRYIRFSPVTLPLSFMVWWLFGPLAGSIAVMSAMWTVGTSYYIAYGHRMDFNKRLTEAQEGLRRLGELSP